MGCVYLARCMVNGKGYVGKTTYSLSFRKACHKSDAEKGVQLAFHRAIRKYGWDAFAWSILTEDDNNEFLCFMEQKWIKRLGTRAPNGYNLTDGGEGTVGLCHSEETKKKISDARIGIEFTPEHRKKLGDSHRGRPRSKEAVEKTIAANTGRKNTEETKLKMSIAAKNRAPVTEETKKILSESHMGIKRSLESRIKQSESAKGKPKPPRTAEHKAKISATLKLYNAKKREMK